MDIGVDRCGKKKKTKEKTLLRVVDFRSKVKTEVWVVRGVAERNQLIVGGCRG